MWQKGFLCGVDSIYLGVDLSTVLDSGDVTVSVILESMLEQASQANATALALSQQ
jgi:hypothetical protein